MKILNRLTLKNLRLNKTRTIVTIIGIILSTALITVVAGMATSAQQTLINAETVFEGNYSVSFRGANLQDIERIKLHRNVQDVYITDLDGIATMPNPKGERQKYVYINSVSKNSVDNCFNFDITEGRFPNNSNEILLSKYFIDSTKNNYKIGDKINLNLGKRVDENGKDILLNMDASLENEKFVETGSKEYTVVGVTNQVSSAVMKPTAFDLCFAYTVADGTPSQYSTAYVQFTPDGEKDYIQTTGEILGLSQDEINQYGQGCFVDLPSTCKYDNFYMHTNLLGYKGYGLGDTTMSFLVSLVLIIVLIIVIASIFVIRNSFAISITEKTKLYGMLASIGATSKQIRKNVLFEGFVLGVIGISFGLALGVGVIALLVVILNTILGDMLNGILFTYSVPILPIAFAIVVSAITILLSTLTIAFKASRIAPITAIRSNNDIKISKRNNKIKSPKLVKKMFGVGGDIAYKNLKRSRKKYRTTVISLVVSIALFIAMSSFMEYGFSYTKQYYNKTDFNVTAVSDEGGTYVETNKEIASLVKQNGIKSMVITRYVNAIFPSEKLTGSFSSDYVSFYILSLDDQNYKNTVKELGLNYNDAKDKAILFDKIKYEDENCVKKFERQTNLKENDEVEVVANKNLKLNICKIAENFPDKFSFFIDPSAMYALVSEDFLKTNGMMDTAYPNAYFLAENATEFTQTAENSGYMHLFFTNYEELVNQNNAIVLVLGIFIYGFIIVISLIGLTNIFNTITTNMRLRSKEFAMLKSVGMTKKEFNRMVRLESLFYGLKSLLFGIPIGIVGGFLIFLAFLKTIEFSYVVPWTAIIISIVFVFLVVWAIMNFSISKVRKQNIIETIRNDNI